MSQWSVASEAAGPTEAWAGRLVGPDGSRSRLSLWADGTAFTLRKEGMSVAARASLTLFGPEQAAEGARLWRALAQEGPERFSETAQAGSTPIYALRKPPFEGEAETNVFGVNGGGAMGLTPCASFALPREGWAAMARLGEALANGMGKKREGALHSRRPALPEPALKALAESLELWAQSAAEPAPPAPKRPGL